MSNTDGSELNHIKTTLVVDCGGHTERFDLPNYPQEYDCEEAGVQRVGNPMPCRIEFEDLDMTHGWSQKLLPSCDVYHMAEMLNSRVSTVLQASVVNDKQRRALEDIVNGYFDEFKHNLINE